MKTIRLDAAQTYLKPPKDAIRVVLVGAWLQVHDEMVLSLQVS